MGVASVVLVYDLVRRRFGRLGGLVAGLALATTPIAVAIKHLTDPLPPPRSVNPALTARRTMSCESASFIWQPCVSM